MNITSLNAAQMGLQPVADETYGQKSILHGQLILAGCSYHVTAIEVAEGESGIWRAIHADYIGEVNALYEMSGSDLTTATIDGKQYLFAIFPHGA